MAKWQNKVPAILIWPSLIRPEAYKGNLPRYKATFLFRADHPELPALKAAVMQAAAEAFPGVPADRLELPLKNGDKRYDEWLAEGKDRPFVKGHFLLDTHANEKDKDGKLRFPPNLYLRTNDPMTGEPAYTEFSGEGRAGAEKVMYGGVLACFIGAFGKWEKGVTCYLNDVVSLNTDGPLGRIATKASAESKFGSADSYNEYVGHVTSQSVMPQQAGAEPW